MKIRTGTILCWLFGHIFISHNKKEEKINGVWMVHASWKRVDCCTRCGIDR